MKRILTILFALSMLGCTSADVYDYDGDGSVDSEDCDADDSSSYPGAPDPFGDGIDQNCDGVDGLARDTDGDGYYDQSDCEPEDPHIFPGAAEDCSDGIDQDCDGTDLLCGDGDDDDSATGDPGDSIDDDGDGFTENEGDCDDSIPGINPFATDLVGDGIDQNCDGMDGMDADEDGHASMPSGGDDCDDFDPLTYSGAPEIWYDGIDQDCEGGNDFDQDEDDYEVDEDCNDLDPSIHPDALEVLDGVDQDCNGDPDGVALGGYYDPAGPRWDMGFFMPGPWTSGEIGEFGFQDGINFDEDCLIGICHGPEEMLPWTPNFSLFGAAPFSAPNQTVFEEPFAQSTVTGRYSEVPWMTYVIRFPFSGVCYAWGDDPSYYTSEGCVERNGFLH